MQVVLSIKIILAWKIKFFNPKFENEYLALNTKIDNVCITAIIIHSGFGLIYLHTQRFIISTNYSFERRCKMHISLTPELEAKVKERVASGYYNNASEVIRDALRFWESNEEFVQQIKLEILKKRLAIGAEQAEQGKFIKESVTDIIKEAKNA